MSSRPSRESRWRDLHASLSARQARVVGPLSAALTWLVGCNDGARGVATASGSALAAEKPLAIVSVGSAITETLFALGLGANVIAVDTSSKTPASTRGLAQVGYHRHLSAEGILSLSPTHVVLGEESGPRETIDAVKAAGVTTTVFQNPVDEAGLASRIRGIGALFGRDDEARTIVSSMTEGLGRLRSESQKVERKVRGLVLYARSSNQLFVAGKKTTAQVMLDLAAIENVARTIDDVSPLTAESAFTLDAELVIVPSTTIAALGSPAAVFETPGLASSAAAKSSRLCTIEDALLFGLGPRTAEGARLLFDAAHRRPG